MADCDWPRGVAIEMTNANATKVAPQPVVKAVRRRE
jgi:hypothetical protein